MAEDKLKQARRLIKQGQKEQARHLIDEILQDDPNHEQAWLWRTKTAGTPHDQRRCLRRVLEINPQNTTAQKALKIVEQSRPAAESEPGPVSDTKQCPHCAETIKAQATVCRFCGRQLASQKKSSFNWITCLAAAGLIGILGISAVCVLPIFLSNSNSPLAVPGGPTNTPGPSPTPVIYEWEGEGDEVIFFDTPGSGPGFINAWYGGDGNFSITLYRSDGEYLDLLVNTIDEYEGKTTYRVNRAGQYYLEVKASGHDFVPKWYIVMAPPQN